MQWSSMGNVVIMNNITKGTMRTLFTVSHADNQVS